MKKTFRFELFTARQMALLLILADEEKPIDFSAATRQLSLSKPVMSRACGVLKDRGFLSREWNENDRRRCIVSLTPAGRKFVDAMCGAA
jgi:DNA-binding MarR family transcriptional regulator